MMFSLMGIPNQRDQRFRANVTDFGVIPESAVTTPELSVTIPERVSVRTFYRHEAVAPVLTAVPDAKLHLSLPTISPCTSSSPALAKRVNALDSLFRDKFLLVYRFLPSCVPKAGKSLIFSV